MDKQEQELRDLGFPQALIDESRELARKGVFDFEPSPDLVERTMEACRPVLEEQALLRAEARHRERMANSPLYRLYRNACDYVAGWIW